MEDHEIVSLFWQRSQTAILEAQKKYDRMCSSIAGRILNTREDIEECVNDTYYSAWNAIPPSRPEKLGSFLARITRNLALKRSDYLQAEKRCQEVTLSLEELRHDLCDQKEIDESLSAEALATEISQFLLQQPREHRILFMRRYWFHESVSELAKRCGQSEGSIKMLLLRMRQKLKVHLKQEGYAL